jgi:membrane-associated phospholipid phosphatase
MSRYSECEPKSLIVIRSLVPAKWPLIAAANPLAGADQEGAAWFHAHLTQTSATLLQALSVLGSSAWIGTVLFFAVLFLAYKRRWSSLVLLIVAVPGGMLLNELVKVLVHRQRPFLEGPFVDWSGYSFASGHAIGATLLYGELALLIMPSIKNPRWRVLTILAASLLVVLVSFSRVALGAHYLSDVFAAIAFGIIWLAVCHMAARLVRRTASHRFS